MAHTSDILTVALLRAWKISAVVGCWVCGGCVGHRCSQEKFTRTGHSEGHRGPDKQTAAHTMHSVFGGMENHLAFADWELLSLQLGMSARCRAHVRDIFRSGSRTQAERAEYIRRLQEECRSLDRYSKQAIVESHGDFTCHYTEQAFDIAISGTRAYLMRRLGCLPMGVLLGLLKEFQRQSKRGSCPGGLRYWVNKAAYQRGLQIFDQPFTTLKALPRQEVEQLLISLALTQPVSRPCPPRLEFPGFVRLVTRTIASDDALPDGEALPDDVLTIVFHQLTFFDFRVAAVCSVWRRAWLDLTKVHTMPPMALLCECGLALDVHTRPLPELVCECARRHVELAAWHDAFAEAIRPIPKFMASFLIEPAPPLLSTSPNVPSLKTMALLSVAFGARQRSHVDALRLRMAADPHNVKTAPRRPGKRNAVVEDEAPGSPRVLRMGHQGARLRQLLSRIADMRHWAGPLVEQIVLEGRTLYTDCAAGRAWLRDFGCGPPWYQAITTTKAFGHAWPPDCCVVPLP